MIARLLISVYSLVKKLVPALAAMLAATVAIGAALSTPAHAQRHLTVEEALKLARENNRDLKAARESLALVQVSVELVRAQLLPNVTAQGRYTYNYPDAVLDPKTFTEATDALASLLANTSSDPTQRAALQQYRAALAEQAGPPITIVKQNQLDFSAYASIPLVVPSAYPAYQSAIAQKRATQANLEVTETTILFGAATGFYGVAGAAELVAARKHAIEVTAETVKNAKARLEAGVVNRVEVTRAELAYIRAVQQLEETEDLYAQVYRSLATLIQLREPFVVDPVAHEFPDRPLDDLLHDALTLRPELRAYDWSITAARKTELSGWLRWLPQLSGFGRFAAGNYVGFSGKEYSFAAGLQADWLLYDGGVRDANRHQAAAQRRQTELQLAQLRDTISDDVAKAQRDLKTKRDALRTAEKAVTLSTETLGLVRAQHAAGTATQLDLLQAQDALANSEAAVAQARFDYALGELQLERNTGVFPPRAGAMR
jgi:outer membrane protein TolC